MEMQHRLKLQQHRPTYDVKLNKPELDGGQIKVWGADGIQTDVTSYDGNNQYVKEVTEGEDFNFQITRNDGFEIENVTVNGVQVAPESTDGSVSTYKLSGVAEEKAITITYNKVETPVEENQDGEAAADEGIVSSGDAVTEQGGQQSDDKVNTASLNDAKETAETHEDTDTEKWITVGKSVTLSNEYISNWWTTYSHSWKIKKGKDVVSINASNSNSISVKGKNAGEATITDTIAWNSHWDGQQEKTITYTIHVSKAVAPTAIKISGADKVTQFKTAQLTYELTPSDAAGEVQWSSSNEQILTVDSNGLVSGLRQGTATVTASVQDKESNSSVIAEKTIQVVANEESTDQALVYYLLDPTKDANSNDTGNWGPQYGTATVNTTGATWTNNKNCFDNVDQRVVSWPNGTNVVTRNSTAWNQIFENYRSSIQSQLGVTITKDDVEEITLVPAKISKDNGTAPDKHLDCNVNIKCKNVATVKYYLYDAGAVKFDMLGSKNYVINGTSKTQPSDVTSKTFPTTKTVNGVTYTFSGWYTNRELTNAAPAFPAKVESSITYYAKYIAGYQVMYNLAGGKFSDGSTNATEKHNEGTNVVVKEEPTRKGYKFTGWTVEGLDNTTISSGESFTMPGNTVTLTANWEEQKIEDFITLTPTDAERVYNGEPLAAGIATASAKKAEANLDGVKIEYQKADGTWTESPAEITATNVSDSTTVKVRVTSENYTGKLEGTEKLTITKRPITITGDGWTSDQPYTGSEHKKTAYTVEEANAENTRGLVAGETATVSYEITGTNVGTYTGTFGNDFQVMKGDVDVTANYNPTKTPGTLAITKAEIAKYVTLTPADVTKVYDGNAYAAGTATAADTNGNDLKIEYQKANGSWTEDPSEITATEVKDSKTVNIRVSSEGNYDGYVTGTEKLTITARPITITGDGWESSQPYTGSEYKKTGYTVEEANTENTRGLVAGETVNTSYEIKGTNVGSYTGTFGDNFEIKTAGGVLGIGAKDVTANYTVTKTPGTLTIGKAEILNHVTLTPNPVTKVYDGEAHTAGIATATADHGNEVKVEYSVNGTDWTTDPSTITATEVKDSVTVLLRASSEGNYEGYVTGKEELTITKRPIEITGSGWTSSQPYTGKAYTKTDYEVEQANAENTRGLVAGETATVSYEITGTNVGTYTGTFGNDFQVMKGDVDVTANYNPTKTPGTLAITKAEIAKYVTLTPADVTKVYDGNAYAAGTATAADTNGNDLKIEYQKADGTWTENPTEITASNVSESKTVNIRVSSEGNYDGYVTGTEKLTITARPITITGDGWESSQPYTGSEYKKTDYTVEAANAENTRGLVAGETAEVVYELKGTNVGTYTGTFGTAVIKKGEEDVTANYTVIKTPGTLAIIKSAIENYINIYPVDVTKVYDGNAYAAGTARATDRNGNNLKIEYSVNGTDWTEDPSEITATEVKDSVTVNVRVSSEGNYDGYVTGTEKLTITPKAVTVTADDLSKIYKEDDPELTATVTGTLGEDTLIYQLSRESGEDVGKYPITARGEAIQGNYTVTYRPGTLTIVAAQRTTELSVTSYNGVYDAENHTITVNGTVDGDKVEYSYDGGKTWVTDLKEYKNVTKGSVAIQVKVTNKNYTPAETILSGTVTITPATLTITTPKAEKVYDGNALTAEGSITGFVNGETATFVTTGSQTEVGNSENTYTLTWDGTAEKTNYTVSESLGTLTVTPQSIVPDPDPEKPSYKGVEVSTPADVPYNGQDQTWQPTVTDADGVALVNGQDYTVSYDKDDRTNVTGTITVTITGIGNYTGTVTRTYQITPKPVTITTNSDEKVFDNTALTAAGSVEGIVEGETYSFTVTGSQKWVGSSTNTYEMVWATEDNHYTAKQSNYTVSENVGTLTVTDGTPETPVDPSLVVNKTHDANQTYKAGDVITFTIKVKNIYDEVKTITLEEQEGVTLNNTVFENVEPGAEITATATYTVTEADIVNGTFTNNVTATFSGVDKEYTGTDTVDEFEDPNPHMTITKTTKDVEENHIYKLGETISYVITVKNDGNLTLTDVTVEDALTGNDGENAWTIETLAPDEEQTFETSYVVTEEDVLAGKVINNVTGTAKDPTNPDKPKTPVTPGEKEDPVETPNPGLTVVKTSDTEGQVTLGQKITYTITVTNNGNVTISGVKLVDPLTRDNWTLGKIKPGETVTREATYTVTEKDIIAGKVENHATATGKDPSGNEVTDEGEKTVTTEPSKPHITVTKETISTPKNGETYALGEKITYKITAKNTGNLTLTNVTVSDELTGDTGDKAFKIDGEFKPGDEKTFKTSYTVTEADLGKTVVNVATATGTTPDPDKPEPGVDPGKKEDPTDQKKPGMSIEKKVIDQKEKYEIGDTVEYKITVTNTGNTTQKNILVEDQMNAAGQAVITKVDGANGTIDGAKVTLDTLAPGKAATITAEYTVVKADRGKTITNAAVATGEGENPKTPNVPVVVEKVYDIHVVHAFAPGNEGNVALPDDYTIENLKPKTVKSLMAKGVTGYVAYPAAQNATVVDRDITVTFLYYKDEIGTDPTNPDKPDGVPDEFQRVVRFVAVNGTVSIDHAVVTLFGEDGKPAKNGVGHLSALQIAAATANAGYDQASLSWAPQAPTMDYNITGDMTFTATFTATPVTPPATPDNPRPNNPTRPSGQTTEPTGNAFVDNVVTPVVETVKEKAAKIQEVFNSDDEDVPLADQNLDNHKCCILHFLIMLITLLVYALATKSMKKRQKKLHEVREELDCELARRGLPLSREKE